MGKSGAKAKGAKAVKSKGFKTDVKNTSKFGKMKKLIRKERKEGNHAREKLEKMIDVCIPSLYDSPIRTCSFAVQP